jgi:glycosyltransferase involved in cell wall biosynthesis
MTSTCAARSQERHARRKLLVLSHVLPFPGHAGQEQRVLYTLLAARDVFDVTFVTTCTPPEADAMRARLLELCDDVVLLPSRCRRNRLARAWHATAGSIYATVRGLKRSNYSIGRVEFEGARLAPVLEAIDADCALFEYWHAAESIPVFRQRGIPCVLDMHDVLWKSFERDLTVRSGLSAAWKRWAVAQYERHERRAWDQFDGIVAINRMEEKLVKASVADHLRIFHAPMGTDIDLWPYSPAPARPPRVAYYGGLGNPHNQKSALECVTDVMPAIWQSRPDTELWLVGSNPPESLQRLSADPRIKVTGYVAEVQKVLRTMTAVLCPWVGTFGFRSRLVEVMALGVPVVSSPEAVSGMELRHGRGMLWGSNPGELAEHALTLIEDPAFAREQGRIARREIERLLSLERTYGKWMRELDEWLRSRSIQ